MVSAGTRSQAQEVECVQSLCSSAHPAAVTEWVDCTFLTIGLKPTIPGPSLLFNIGVHLHFNIMILCSGYIACVLASNYVYIFAKPCTVLYRSLRCSTKIFYTNLRTHLNVQWRLCFYHIITSILPMQVKWEVIFWSAMVVDCWQWLTFLKVYYLCISFIDTTVILFRTVVIIYS